MADSTIGMGDNQTLSEGTLTPPAPVEAIPLERGISGDVVKSKINTDDLLNKEFEKLSRPFVKDGRKLNEKATALLMSKAQERVLAKVDEIKNKEASELAPISKDIQKTKDRIADLKEKAQAFTTRGVSVPGKISEKIKELEQGLVVKERPEQFTEDDSISEDLVVKPAVPKEVQDERSDSLNIGQSAIQKSAMGVRDAVLKQELLTQKELTDSIAGIDAEIENQRVLLEQQQEKERERQKAMDVQMDKIRQIHEDMLSNKIDADRFMSSRSTGQRIAMGIGVFLGGLGGGQNRALQIIENAIDRDVRSQKDNISKNLEGSQNLYKMMLSRFSSEREAELATRAFLKESTKLKMQKHALKYKSGQAKINAQLAVAKLDHSIAKDMQELALDGYKAQTDRAKLSSQSLPKVTEGSLRDAKFYSIMEDTEKTLGTLVSKGFDPGSSTRYLTGATSLPNWMRSEEEQRYMALKKAFIQASLRKDSGAAIAPSEYEEKDKAFFPQPSDTPQTLKDKARRRREEIKAMKSGAMPVLLRQQLTQGENDFDFQRGS